MKPPVKHSFIKATPVSELPITKGDFLKSYNQTIPETFPRATNLLLGNFKETNAGLFKNGDLWSLDIHRKKFMDWLSMNSRPTEGS